MTTARDEEGCCKTTGTARSGGGARCVCTDGGRRSMEGAKQSNENHGLAQYQLLQLTFCVRECVYASEPVCMRVFIGLFNTGKILLL